MKADLPLIAEDRFATGRELLVFLDQLGLRERPERYWIAAWVTSSSNIVVGTAVVTAGLLYRYKKFDESFWIVRLERRATGGRQSKTTEDMEIPQTGSRYITASTFNCHLALTTGYAAILFSSVVQTWCTRGYTSSPLIDGAMMDCLMMLALWTKACFGCIGYIELLLPNVPAFSWNLGFIGTWAIAVLTGLVLTLKVEQYNGKVGTLVSLIYAQVQQDGIDAPPAAFAVTLARNAWADAIKQATWIWLWKLLVGVGGIAQAILYLSVFVKISLKVRRELWQVRTKGKDNRDIEAKRWWIERDAPALTSPDCYHALRLFLLHCSIDHINVTLQSLGIGLTSLYMALHIRHDIVFDPQAANDLEQTTAIYSFCIFAVLYPINAFNMVMPFIWYPPSRIALMTKQVLLDRKQSQEIHDATRSLRTQASSQCLLRRAEDSVSYTATPLEKPSSQFLSTLPALLAPSGAEEVPTQQLRRRSSNQQLILDALVMSHSLPIQGFYCRPQLKVPTAIQEDSQTEH